MEDCTQKEVNDFKQFLKYLSKQSQYPITQQIEKKLLESLEVIINFMCHPIINLKFPQIQRLTINNRIFKLNKRIYDISFLKYPPKKLVTEYGRCNLRQQSILYSAFDGLTVLNELKPKKGDLITISTWKAIDDCPLVVSPILRQPSNGTYNPRIRELEKSVVESTTKYPNNIRLKITLLNDFIADSFTKRIPDGNNAEYLFSAYFADRILNKFENGKVEAIYYPSVKSGLNFENLAIKPNIFDSKYKLTHVKESVIDMEMTDYTTGNGVMMLRTGEATQFDYNLGKIIWNIDNRQTDENMRYIKDTYGYEQ